MGLRAVTDPGMSFPPTHPPAWWEHQRPEPLLQGWSCWWEGRTTGEPARAVGLDPWRPSPALAWPCKRRDRVGGRSQQPPPYHAAGPSVCPHQPSPDADSDPIYPRVTGYEPLSEGPGHPCLQGAQLTGCPPSRKAGGVGCSTGVCQRQGKVGGDTWEELTLPTALSKSRVMNLEALGSNSVLVSPAPVGTCEVPTQGRVGG